ncbi:MAG: hypothetical protein KZQ88_16840 [Candidatus Thiodiazotropha sp. (ex Dulcina madagascariensis)]|nr:hypothetical protein [Candidatus Thiodiazotropha sp. (ex Dulcina madagascariensis)]MCU7925988.1 hypothetical protein [Candidatus Thiodiazotropha sp. (ex Dulcina madagascariensis)]
MESIKTKYDEEIGGYRVYMPEYIAIRALETWANEFGEALEEREVPQAFSLLLDINKHDFESIECLKYLRDFLYKLNQMQEGLTKIAFVQPVKYKVPGIVSRNEAYFSNMLEAETWLTHDKI